MDRSNPWYTTPPPLPPPSWEWEPYYTPTWHYQTMYDDDREWQAHEMIIDNNSPIIGTRFNPITLLPTLLPVLEAQSERIAVAGFWKTVIVMWPFVSALRSYEPRLPVGFRRIVSLKAGKEPLSSGKNQETRAGRWCGICRCVVT